MTRSYKGIRPKKHRVYSTDQLMMLYGVSRNTVSNWIADGLHPSDNGIPKLFRGEVVRQFRETMRLRHRVVVGLHEAFCFRCKRAVVPTVPCPRPRSPGTGNRLQFGTCPDCQAQVTKIQGATDRDTAGPCRNPKTTPDRGHEDVASIPVGIGNERGFDASDLHLVNDRMIHTWLNYAGRYSEKTIDSHLAAIRYLEAVTGGMPFDQLRREDVSKLRDDLKRRAAADATDALSASTIRHKQSHVREFLTWLCKQDGFRRLPRDLADHLELPRAVTAAALRETRKDYPTLEEAEALLSTMPATSLPDQRARAIFALSFLGALRADTLASLRIKHVDIENRRILQDARGVRTKAGKSLEISWFPIPEAFGAVVTDWIRTLGRFGFTSEDALFPRQTFLKHWFPKPGADPVAAMTSTHVVTQAFALACRDTPQNYTPHAAKHTIAAERDLRALTRMERKAWSENMGHETEQTTEHYYGKLSDEARIELIEGIGDPVSVGASKLSDAEKIALVDRILGK